MAVIYEKIGGKKKAEEYYKKYEKVTTF